MAAQCGNAVPALGGVEDMLICDLDPGHVGGHSALNPDGSRVSWMPLAASTTETAKPSNQELAGLTRRALEVAKAHEHSGSFDLCDLLRALVARVEALLAERDALKGDVDAFRDVYRSAEEHVSDLAGRVAVLEAALRNAQAACGNPDAAEGCRQVLRILGAVLAGGDAACGALMDSNIRCVLPKGHDGGHAGGPVGDAAAEEKP